MKEQCIQRPNPRYSSLLVPPPGLTVSDMHDPEAVVASFFTKYDLPEIKSRLTKLSQLAVHPDGATEFVAVSILEDLKTLVEATWQMHGQKRTLLGEREDAGADDHKWPQCYQSIRAFFESFTLPDARNYLLSSVRAAEGPTIWKREDPADLLFFYENLEGMVDDVFTVIRKNLTRDKAVLAKHADMNLCDNRICCGASEQDVWDYFPRNLSAKEFIDPYKALQKFTSWRTKKEWKEILRSILSHALGADSLSESGVHLELVRINGLLHKMLEAAYVIDLRIHG